MLARVLFLHAALLVGLTIFGTGCGDAVSSGKNTALDSVDLVTMTDDMARQIVADPAVKQAFTEGGPLKIVVRPVENQMTGEILPKGPADAFTARVRGLLAKHAPNEFTWIMNRDAFHALQQQELDVDLGPNPDSTNPQYALTAIFSSLTNENADRRSSYYLCTYQLTSLDNRTILWEGKYEVKKVAVKGLLD
jgi:hypothetical protein